MRLLSLLVLLLGASAIGFAQASPKVLPADRPIEQAVDHYIDLQLKENRVEPAPHADDAEFLRRITLDLVGRIPTLAELDSYLADADPNKKANLVDRLMASPAYARHQAQELYTLLRLSDNSRKAPKGGALHEYLLTAVKENRSWDGMFRDLILPDETNAKTKGAAEFLKSRVKDLNRLTIDVSSIFFGVNVSCAQCHDHPHVPAWTQDHFYGMKSFLARTFDNGGFLAEKDFGSVKYIPNKGQEKVAPVMFLTGKKLDVPGLTEPTKEEKKKEQARLDSAKSAKKPAAPPEFSLRARFVETVLEPGQRDYFARALVNRVWHRLYGRGLVMPLDQMHLENPPSHPELMHWLARDLVEHGYDLRRLTRGLVLSQAYARSSRTNSQSVPPQYFAVAQVRALTPAQMGTSLRLATADQSGGLDEAKLETIERSGERLASMFVQPGDNFQVSVSEAMLLANNDSVAKELLESGLVAQLAKEPDLKKRADLAVRATLGRPAEAQEISLLSKYMKARDDRVEAACRQVVWALLTSAEFRFNY
jgi:hypothetical protein